MDRHQGDRSKSKRRANGTGKLSKLFGSRGSREKPSESVESLESALAHFYIASKHERKAAEEYRRAYNELGRWAEASGNAAIDDVVGRLREAVQLLNDRKLVSVDNHSSSVDHMKYIIDMDQKVSDLKERCAELKRKEILLKEQIEKGERGRGFLKKPKGGDLLVWRRQLADVQNEYALCVAEYKREKRELHVCTMLKVRHAFKGMYDANHDLAVQSQVAFECLREIVEQVPAVSTQDVSRMNYQSKPITKELVDQLKANLSSSQTQRTVRRRSEPPRRQTPASPPPPYTPTAPPEPQVQRNHVSDSYLLRGDRAVVFAHEVDSTPIRPPPRAEASHVRSSRLYPDLPPNPYAVQRTSNAVA
ncbi:hypothetical protein QR680_005456 [Steinernema hermaphroditum]|uniref:Uncharacterized protein n=1 Tax=Steinernema hermaphroditum TaxID=289476 RepID=A0AA39HT64_9BILA|nr:hypothetical protein QR680_005456 [Steinernema hermaphroditum]